MTEAIETLPLWKRPAKLVHVETYEELMALSAKTRADSVLARTRWNELHLKDVDGRLYLVGAVSNLEISYLAFNQLCEVANVPARCLRAVHDSVLVAALLQDLLSEQRVEVQMAYSQYEATLRAWLPVGKRKVETWDEQFLTALRSLVQQENTRDPESKWDYEAGSMMYSVDGGSLRVTQTGVAAFEIDGLTFRRTLQFDFGELKGLPALRAGLTVQTGSPPVTSFLPIVSSRALEKELRLLLRQYSLFNVLRTYAGMPLDKLRAKLELASMTHGDLKNSRPNSPAIVSVLKRARATSAEISEIISALYQYNLPHESLLGLAVSVGALSYTRDLVQPVFDLAFNKAHTYSQGD